MSKKYQGVLTGLIVAGGLLLTLWLGMNGGAAAARLLLAPGNPVLSPAANAYDVPRDAAVSITYDEDIDATTVTTRTFAVHAMQTGQVLAGYSVNGGEIKVTPAQPFKPGELVQVSATTGTLGLDASAPLTPTVWQFWARPLLGTAYFSGTTRQLGYSLTHGLAVGDLNGDGWLDLVFANYTLENDANDVWLNQGAGVFTRTQVMLGDNSLAVALGDLDGDGDLDAFFANRDRPNRVWLNDGTGVLSDTGQTLGDSSSYDVALGDVDGDGDLDAVVANSDAQNNRVWLNDGTGVFSGGQIFETRNSAGLALGDLDGDGDLDVFFTNYFLRDTVWLNDGLGTFVYTWQSPGTANSSEVALGDVDADGDLDAVVANNRSSDVVWLNDGAGNFNLGQNFNSSNSLGVALGDLDSDGDLDAFLVGVKRHSVWLNDGTGVLTDSMQELGDFYSYSAALGDFNGDGALDLVSASYRDAEDVDNAPNYIWFNQLHHVYLPLVLR